MITLVDMLNLTCISNLEEAIEDLVLESEP